MKKFIVPIIIVAIFFIAPLLFADEDIIVGYYCYTYGDNETLVQARKFAWNMSVRDAIERYGVFMSAISKAENFDLTDDLVQNMSILYLRDIQEFEHTEKGKTICYGIEATISPEDIKNAIEREIVMRAQGRKEEEPRQAMIPEPKTFPQGYHKVKIPERSVVPIKLIQHLKGGQVVIGQNVDFEVSTDIIVDNFIVVKQGAPAYGNITVAGKAGYVSQGGKIGLNIDYCKATDGSKIYLKSVLQKEAESHMGGNIAASVLLCPLLLAVKGEEAELPIGTEFKSYTENDVIVKVLASEKLTDRDIDQILQKEIEERKRIEEERIEKEKREEKKKKLQERGGPGGRYGQ